jgi:hypothetical protein
MALLIFHQLLNGGVCLFSTDDNIGAMAASKHTYQSALPGYWMDLSLLGTAGGCFSPAWINFFLLALPSGDFINWIHAVDMVLGSLFLMFFLRSQGLTTTAILLGGLGTFWLGCNLTIVYAGHTPKFGVLMLATCALYGVGRLEATSKVSWAVIAGGALGAMFLEQLDVALYFGLLLGGYALFTLWRKPQIVWWKRCVYLMLPFGLTAFWLATPGLLQGYLQNIKNIVQVAPEDHRAKWYFVTQWSLPPEESGELAIPGYYGWRSGEPEGNYWGRLGRSENWALTGQGFMNFKLDNWYVGVVLLLFASLASLRVWMVGHEDDNRLRVVIVFWLSALVITLLLSFGKFFPLYKLFYQLPVVNNIRNPVKFMPLFQLTLSILAAYGLHIVLKLEGCITARKNLPI